MKQVSRLILIVVALMTGLPSWAASRQVTGTVTDLSGEPMVGASIMLENSRTGCMADIDGKFSLQVPDGPATLKVALIGYQSQNVKVAAGQTNVDIKLKEDAQTLEETVVVGYGTQKKVNLTGAVAALDGKSLEGRPVSNVSSMLQGAVAGLNVTTSSGKPGSSATLNIRGRTSINSAGPLVLIDGAIGDMDQVDPNDIASISVIKDASAAAVYGARAAFGVILITTKGGSEQDGKATVRYNGRFGWDETTQSTDFETSGYWHLRMLEDFHYGQTKSYLIPSYTDEDYMELLSRVNDKTENPERPWAVIKEINGKKQYRYYGNTDWWNELWKQRRFLTQHNVSLSGGNKNIRYFVSGGYKHNDGLAKYNNDKYNQYTLRSRVNFNINKYADFEQNMAYFGSSYNYQGDGSMENTLAYTGESGLPIFPLKNPDGTYIYENSLFSYKPANGRAIVMMNGLHPGENRKNNFTTTSRLNIKPIKQLTISGDFTYRFFQHRHNTRSNNFEYSQYPGEIKVWNAGVGLDDFMERTTTYNYYSANALATYKDTFNDKHNLTVVAGYNYENRNYKQHQTKVANLGIPELNDIGLAPSMEGAEVKGEQSDYFLQGIFGRINYDYLGKYLVELSGRYDGTSRFAKGHRWGFFPSGSIGWRFSEEKFFASLNPWWSNGKIRFSYGSLGNQNTSDLYTFLRKVSITTSSGDDKYTFDNVNTAKWSSVGIPIAADFTWEKANQWDLGFDLGFFNNRLNATVDLYIRDTKDMITDGVTLPAVYGASEPKMNAADLRTKGYEVSLEWNDAFTLFDSKFQYNVGFNISEYRSTITKYDNPDRTFAKDYYVGKEFGEIWGFRTGGLFQTTEEAQKYASEVDLSYVTKSMNDGWQAGDMKFLDIDNDGKISIGENTVDHPGDREKLGNSLPRLQYGFRAGFNYYGFDANIFFQGTGNHYWYPESSNMSFWGFYSTYERCTYLRGDFRDLYWTEDNPNSYFPRAKSKMASNGYLQFTNDRYLQNLRYLRLKNLTVGYTLPKKWTRVAGIDKLRFYFTAENLAYWSPLKENCKYIDPEACFQQNKDNDHWDMLAYPWPKTFTFGIDLQF